MINFFIKKFFPQLWWWILSTLLLELFTWSYFPQMVESFLQTIQKYPKLCSVIVLLTSFLFYILYVVYRFASDFYRTYCKNVKHIDKSLWNCYLKFVIEDRNIISNRIHSLQLTTGGDLFWENQGLEITPCKQDICPNTWPFVRYVKRLSTRRRNRMIDISLSYLSWRVNTCFAVETHLKDIISDNPKYLADCEYRDKQINKIKKNLFTFKLDNRRIIIIKKSDWSFLLNQHLNRLRQYLQWHINNKWDAILIVKDTSNAFTLSSIYQLPSDEYDDFSDFVIIKRKFDDNFVVFAQNSNGRARIIDDDPGKGIYNDWFLSVWNFALQNANNAANNEYFHVNQNFVNSI